MSLHIHIHPHETYLHILAEGRPTYFNLIEGWKRILEESTRQGLSAILYESVTEKADPTDILHFAVDFARLSLPENVRIGLLSADNMYADVKITETVIRNRMPVPVHSFTSKSEALDWLLKGS